MARYVLIDRRTNRLCEFSDFTHGETADLFWVDATDRPEITLAWKYFETTGEWTPPVEISATEVVPASIVDYGVQVYKFYAGNGLAEHQHPFAHDHVVEAGRTLVVVKGQEPVQCGAGDRVVLPPDIPHSITALENGTRFTNTRLPALPS